MFMQVREDISEEKSMKDRRRERNNGRKRGRSGREGRGKQYA